MSLHSHVQGPVVAVAGAIVIASSSMVGVDTAIAAGTGVVGILVLLMLHRQPWVLLALAPLAALAVEQREWLLVAFGLAALCAAFLIPRGERDRAERQLQRLPSVRRLGLALADADSRLQVVDEIVAAVRQVLPGIGGVAVVLVDRDEEEMEVSGRWGAVASRQDQDSEAARRDRYVTDQGRTLSDQQDGGWSMRLPLRGDGGKVLGLLHVIAPEEIDGADRELLELMGRVSGIALDGMEYLERARHLALQDDLTGLYGRHEFERRLAEQTAIASRAQTRVGLLFIDLDHLKAINDRFGHGTGDKALRDVAEAIRLNIPDDAIACRFGGEEFTVIVPAADATTVPALAEAILATVRDQVRIGTTAITASAGWALSRPDEHIADLVDRADAACYRAKDAGRDRVEGEA